jgi:hypothetical protein
MATALFVKDGLLCMGADLATSVPVFVPRDAGSGPPALVWGIDRTTWALNPLSVDADGKLGISFSGAITLGAVTIKDATSSDNLDVIAGEGGTISTDNFRGLLTYGAWNDSGTLKTKLFHMDSGGNLKIVKVVTFLTPYQNELAGTSLNGVAFSGTSSFASNKKVSLISLNFSTNLSKTVTIFVKDATNAREYTIQYLSAWTGQNITITDPLILSSNMEIKIDVTATAGACMLYYRVEAETV